MGPDLQIVQNTSHHLQVTSPEMFFWIGTYCVLAVDLAVFLLATKVITPAQYVGHPVSRVVGQVVPVLCAVILFFVLGWSNTLDIDWDKGTVTTTNRFLLGFSTTHAMVTGDIDRAFIDYDRMGPRVGLQLSRGGAVLPLGTISMYKPSQYAVVEAINDGLKGRTPPSPTRGDQAGEGREDEKSTQGFHMKSGADSMMQQEHEFEDRLNKQKQQEKR